MKTEERLAGCDLHLVANAFTVTRIRGAQEGINLGMHRYPEHGNILCIYVGPRRFMRANVYGAFVHRKGQVKYVRRLQLKEVVTRTGTLTYRLQRPDEDEPTFSYIYVDTSVRKVSLGNAHKMFTLKHPVRSGCTTTGTVCFRSQNEWLIRLDSGRRLNVFFPDGHVYVCTQRGMNFTEISLCPYEALKVRIEDAESRLRAAHNEGSRPAALSLIVREMEQLYQVILPSEIETESCRNLLVERFFSRLTLRERELMSPQARRSIIASLLRWEGFRGIAQSFNE